MPLIEVKELCHHCGKYHFPSEGCFGHNWLVPPTVQKIPVGDYSKSVWIQSQAGTPWQYISEVRAGGVTTWFRDGIRVEPFDFDLEAKQALHTAEYHLRSGTFTVYDGPATHVRVEAGGDGGDRQS